jgi:hypothetical protein
MDVRAGELSAAELENLMVIVGNPRQFKIPDWFLNRKKDHKDGRYSQVVSNALDMKLRDDLERLKKIRSVSSVIKLEKNCITIKFFLNVGKIETALFIVYLGTYVRHSTSTMLP